MAEPGAPLPPLHSRVRKSGGDYTFEGSVRAVLTKRSGAVRLVVEDDRGLLLILNPGQVEVVAGSPERLALAPEHGEADSSPVRLDQPAAGRLEKSARQK